jgi:hypothetical protein
MPTFTGPFGRHGLYVFVKVAAILGDACKPYSIGTGLSLSLGPTFQVLVRNTSTRHFVHSVHPMRSLGLPMTVGIG